jgi:hypothetical protein
MSLLVRFFAYKVRCRAQVRGGFAAPLESRPSRRRNIGQERSLAFDAARDRRNHDIGPLVRCGRGRSSGEHKLGAGSRRELHYVKFGNP